MDHFYSLWVVKGLQDITSLSVLTYYYCPVQHEISLKGSLPNLYINSWIDWTSLKATHSLWLYTSWSRFEVKFKSLGNIYKQAVFINLLKMYYCRQVVPRRDIIQMSFAFLIMSLKETSFIVLWDLKVESRHVYAILKPLDLVCCLHYTVEKLSKSLLNFH